ncbi:hypothetical protein D3C72_1901000 [compost metagenome]
MIVTATCNAWVCRKVGKLPGFGGFQHFYENATRVAVLGYLIGECRWRQVAQISGVQRSDQTHAHVLGNQGGTAVTEAAYLLR